MTTSSQAPGISVIVPVRNTEKTLGAQLEALTRQDYCGAWEAIVVDNGSSDGSVELAHRWLEHLPLRIVSAGDSPDLSIARNVGVREARADLIVFCDGDDEVEPGWLSAMVAALQAHPLVFGALDFRRLNSAQAAAAEEGTVPSGPAWLSVGGAGCNLGLRRSLFDELGGFPEGFGRGQDTVFCWRAQLAGHRPMVERTAIVHYRLKGNARRAMFTRYYRDGRSSAKRYREFRNHGMPRSPARDIVYDWANVPVQFLRGNSYFASQMAGWRVGRLVGSMRSRVLQL